MWIGLKEREKNMENRIRKREKEKVNNMRKSSFRVGEWMRHKVEPLNVPWLLFIFFISLLHLLPL